MSEPVLTLEQFKESLVAAEMVVLCDDGSLRSRMERSLLTDDEIVKQVHIHEDFLEQWEESVREEFPDYWRFRCVVNESLLVYVSVQLRRAYGKIFVLTPVEKTEDGLTVEEKEAIKEVD